MWLKPSLIKSSWVRLFSTCQNYHSSSSCQKNNFCCPSFVLSICPTFLKHRNPLLSQCYSIKRQKMDHICLRFGCVGLGFSPGILCWYFKSKIKAWSIPASIKAGTRCSVRTRRQEDRNEEMGVIWLPVSAAVSCYVCPPCAKNHADSGQIFSSFSFCLAAKYLSQT